MHNYITKAVERSSHAMHCDRFLVDFWFSAFLGKVRQGYRIVFAMCLKINSN